LALLLLLLVDLFHKLLDLPALLSAVTLRVKHRAPLATLIADGRLIRPLVTTWAMTPTSRCRCSSGSSGDRLVLVTNLFLLLLLAAALGSHIGVGLAGLPCL
jgi:hypothetical protein